MGLDAYGRMGTEWGAGMPGTRGLRGQPGGDPAKTPGSRRIKHAGLQSLELSEGGPETHGFSSYSRDSELGIS